MKEILSKGNMKVKGLVFIQMVVNMLEDGEMAYSLEKE